MALQTDRGVLKLITYVSIVRGDEILLVRYATPPNPSRDGWWVPAPELDYGQAPDEVAGGVLRGLGLEGERAGLLEAESFQTPNGWHCIFHYLARTEREPRPDGTYSRCAWFKAADLPPAADFAHGGWERKLAARRLAGASA